MPSPTRHLGVRFHHRAQRLHPGRQAEPIKGRGHFFPRLTHRRSRHCDRHHGRCGHGVAFLSWIRHPEPTGSRRATPLHLFQHWPGHSHVAGQNVSIEYRWAEGSYNRLPTLASDLVSNQVALIVANGGVATALAAKSATTVLPILFVIGVDPVSSGLVVSLNRPGGNMTGVTVLAASLAPKRLELLVELAPNTNVVAALVNPSNPAFSTPELAETERAAQTLGLHLHVLNATSESQIDAAFEAAVQAKVQALLVSADPFFTTRLKQIIALAARHRIPAIYYNREYATAGGLMSYGGSLTEAHRQVGIYAGRVLKGVKPLDLPVQQSAKVDVAINLRTAKALGIEVPQNLLALADEVIE
jgi:putative tryptophan/tyrosine transport system substrate-binding protein